MVSPAHHGFPAQNAGLGSGPAERPPGAFFIPRARHGTWSQTRGASPKEFLLSLCFPGCGPAESPPRSFCVLHRTWVWTRGASPTSINIQKNLVVDPRSVPPEVIQKNDNHSMSSVPLCLDLELQLFDLTACCLDSVKRVPC